MNELKEKMWDEVEKIENGATKSKIVDFHRKSFPSLPVIAIISTKGVLWISTEQYYKIGLDGVLGLDAENFMCNISFSGDRLRQLRDDINFIEREVLKAGESDPSLKWLKSTFQTGLEKISVRVVPAVFVDPKTGEFEPISEHTLDFIVDHLYFTDCIPLSEGDLGISMDQIEHIRSNVGIVRPKDTLNNYVRLSRGSVDVMPEDLLSLFKGKYGHFDINTNGLPEEIVSDIAPITSMSDNFPMTTSIGLYTEKGVLVVPDELRMAVFSIFGYEQRVDGQFSYLQQVNSESLLKMGREEFNTTIDEILRDMNEAPSSVEQTREKNSWAVGILRKIYDHLHDVEFYFVVPLRDIDVFHIPALDFNAPMLKIFLDRGKETTIKEWKREVAGRRFSWAIIKDREVISGIMTSSWEGCSNTLVCLGFNGNNEEYQKFLEEVKANDIN